MTQEPTLWRDMTPEEKGALLLAEHEGKAIEVFGLLYPDMWYEDFPAWEDECAYRIKPEPKRETVTQFWERGRNNAYCIERPLRDTHRITFDTIDGKPDPSSIKIEEITQ